MNWQHLTYFIKAAQCENLTKASDELFITSSALSRAIISLETELGVQLFDRDGRNIRINKYGRIFYDHVFQAVNKINEGVELIHEQTNEHSGLVLISSIFSVGSYFIPKIVAKFMSSYPHIRLVLTQKTTAQILRDVKSGATDIGFCGDFNASEYPEISREYLYEEDIKLIVPKSHRLANQEETFFDEIKDEIFIGYNNDTGIRKTIYEATARKGDPKFKFKTAFTSNEDGNVVGLVREGLGIAFIVDVHSLKTDDLAVLRVKDLLFKRSIYMVNRSNYLTPAIRTFRKHLISSTFK